jgi:ABC-2 type transport system permease protein
VLPQVFPCREFDQRNSFPPADQRELTKLREPLLITVHLAPEDPRYADLRRNVLAKLERVVPHVNIRLASSTQTVLGSSTEETYGEIEYSYAARSAKSRSTSHREALPILYELAGRPIPAPVVGAEYPGYPLVTDARIALPWFFAALKKLVVLVGQKKAVAIAVRNVSGRRRWSKLQEWLRPNPSLSRQIGVAS